MKSSDTISNLEMDALYQQIEDAMTIEQVKAIEVMTITNDDINTLMADLGVGYETSASQSVATTSNASLQGMPPDGGAPGGDMGMPPAGDMGGVIISADNNDARISTSVQTNASSVAINVFIDPLIQLLKERVVT